MLFCGLLVFFISFFFSEFFSGIPSVSKSLDPDQAKHFVSIWFLTACKSYQQTTLAGYALKCVKNGLTRRTEEQPEMIYPNWWHKKQI